ncbi:MAG: nucleotidyl transferase AbiEii/AbiGii toxin family protein [Candidatus Aminicenantes bacterium]|nr:MAG: nucleotidyl transferase AbiEii/AbiGii toxin family protein [Candidatus Aminicenantes bacterium]
MADAEKDYFLAVILKMIYNSFLADSLVFKGGTAIHHCYLEQLRFSNVYHSTQIFLTRGNKKEEYLKSAFFMNYPR